MSGPARSGVLIYAKHPDRVSAFDALHSAHSCTLCFAQFIVQIDAPFRAPLTLALCVNRKMSGVETAHVYCTASIFAFASDRCADSRCS